MDAVLADGADKWEAPEDCLAAARAVCEGVAAALAPGGVFLQLTFSQPHFRRKYLTVVPGMWASVEVTAVSEGMGYWWWALRKA